MCIYIHVYMCTYVCIHNVVSVMPLYSTGWSQWKKKIYSRGQQTTTHEP